MPYLPYEEPGLTVILSLASFLLLLNGIRYILDRLVYCGIIGEILIGVIWGLPVGGDVWLTESTQTTIQILGYLGLVGLVFEGGLSTDLALLRKAAFMSISVAAVGLLMPIALSFILLVLPFPNRNGMMFPTPLAAFSAGASLCSTSLGTIFAILTSVKMLRTRIGVVLVGAAMLDDVVGLVMVKIVASLGNGGLSAWSIARPIAASFGLLFVTIFITTLVLVPIWRLLIRYFQPEEGQATRETQRSKFQTAVTNIRRAIPHFDFVLSTTVLIVFVTIASVIGASILFAAFIAGGVVNRLWTVRLSQQTPQSTSDANASKIYEKYYKPLMDFILVPFFFASIGFSIPITSMFSPPVLWKGIIYSLLMMIAKGLVMTVVYFEYFMQSCRRRKLGTSQRKEAPPGLQSGPQPQDEESPGGPPHYEALLVGAAMIARGEIGFLIASLSQSSGTLTFQPRGEIGAESSAEEMFLVIIWAVVLCTITGPLTLGLLVKRRRRGSKEISINWQ